MNSELQQRDRLEDLNKKLDLKKAVTELKNTQEGVNNMLEDGKEWIRDV